MIIAQIRGMDNSKDDLGNISFGKEQWAEIIRREAEKEGLQDSVLIEFCSTACEDYFGEKAPYVILQMYGSITGKYRRFHQGIIDAGIERVFTSTINQRTFF